MKINPQSPTSILNKIDHYDRYERELSKLKFHLKMKRRIYDETEFKDINQRLKFCEAFYKKQKYQTMKDQAQKILCENVKSKGNMYKQMKSKLQISRKMRMKPGRIGFKLQKNVQNFRINLKSQQSQLTDNKVVMEYELTPISLKKPLVPVSKSRVKTVADEKKSNERFVSDFEKQIKQDLSKIHLNSYDFSRYSQIDSPHKKVSSKRYYESIPIRQSSEKPQIQHYYSPTKDLAFGLDSKRKNYSSISNYTNSDYSGRKDYLVRSKMELKQLQRRQIQKLRFEEKSILQKNRALKSIYSKYEERNKIGDADSLDLMCQATLTRANVVLDQCRNN